MKKPKTFYEAVDELNKSFYDLSKAVQDEFKPIEKEMVKFFEKKHEIKEPKKIIKFDFDLFLYRFCMTILILSLILKITTIFMGEL